MSKRQFKKRGARGEATDAEHWSKPLVFAPGNRCDRPFDFSKAVDAPKAAVEGYPASPRAFLPPPTAIPATRLGRRLPGPQSGRVPPKRKGGAEAPPLLRRLLPLSG